MKPQTDSAEEEKHIYSHISHSAKAIESIFTWQTHMKEDDEEHGSSHQFTTKSADIRQFYIFYLHRRKLSGE